MDVSTALRTRLEVREFADRRVASETKRAILNAGRLAPSGKNLQHWDFVLVDDPDGIDALAAASRTGGWVAGADFAVVVLTDPSYGYHEIDAGRAVTNMQLEAWSHGIGSCIYTGVDDRAMQDLLEIPEEKVVSLVAGFGHPTRPVESFVGKKDRRPLEEVVHHGHYGGKLSV